MMTAMSGKFLPSPNPTELAENGPNRYRKITPTSIRCYSIANLVERWTCDWKVADSDPGLEGPCRTISCAVPVIWMRPKTEAPSQSPVGAGSLT